MLSYAEVVKGEHKSRQNALASSKTQVFWANKHNISKQPKVWPRQANASLSQDNKTESVTKTAFSHIAQVADASIDIGTMKISNSLNMADQVDIDIVCDTRPHESDKNSMIGDTLGGQQKLLFDAKNSDDKFINSVIFND